ncbi:MAG: mercuric transporter MerT family protein [Nevskiales bacterium]
MAYWQIFRAEAACAPGEVCAEPRVQRRRKTLFWTVTTFVTALLLSPYLIPNLL